MDQLTEKRATKIELIIIEILLTSAVIESCLENILIIRKKIIIESKRIESNTLIKFTFFIADLVSISLRFNLYSEEKL